MIKPIIVCGIKTYQRISPMLLLKTCRFTPSCSQYALDAISHKGVLKGIWLTVCRIARCHPFSKPCHDPVR